MLLFKGSDYVKKNSVYNIIALIIAILPIVIGIYLIEDKTIMKHTKFHIIYVLVCSLITTFISIIAYIEFSRSRKISIFYVCLGFVGISILYGFHGLVTPGNSIFKSPTPKSNINAFVFFGDLSRAWFALMLFIPRLIKKELVSKFYNKRTILIISIFIITSSLLLIYNPLMFPNVKDLQGKDTFYAVLIKVATLTLLGISSISYFESYRIAIKLQTLTLFLGVFLVMNTVIIFLISVPWGSIWWFAHNLYLISFIIIGCGILLSLKNKNHQYFNVWNEVTEYIEEIVNKKENLEKEVTNLDYLANHDSLTGLFNKTYFINFLDTFIEKAKGNKKTCSVLFIDLDGFKAVNDTYGHDVGDKLLKVISKILTDNIREVDLASRFGGDEFIIFLYNISKEDVTKISKRIVSLLSKTIWINQYNCSIGASIGISMFPENGDNSQILINKSDMSMYMVKKRGKNDYCFYEEKC